MGALGRVASYLKRRKFPREVIVVDDGSTDRSAKLISQFVKNHPGFSLLKNSHQGKAAAVITGMLKARGKYILFTDLDQATPINEVEKFLPYFEKGSDVVIGSRNTRREGAPILRLAMARGFMALRSLILGLRGITDTQCGFKAFKREIAQNLFKKLKLYSQKINVKGSTVTAGFDVELLFLAKKLGYSIIEVPVTWHYVESKRVNLLKDSWEGFWDLVKIRLNDIRGLYD